MRAANATAGNTGKKLHTVSARRSPRGNIGAAQQSLRIPLGPVRAAPVDSRTGAEENSEDMRIAQVAPLYESVPPKLYGGTERVVSYLTEELVRMGHEVTLFASGDSETRARLVACCPEALRLNKECIDPLAHHILMLDRVFRESGKFDIVHFHCDYLHFPLSRRLKVLNLTTLHGRLDLPDLTPLYREFTEMRLVSISNSQRTPLPWLNWQGTVYHGLPDGAFRFHSRPGKYLAFLGRICPEKGVDSAIEIAQKSGIELRIAAKVDRVDVQYFEEVIRPMLDHPLVRYVGEICEGQKDEFLGNALALLAPVNWPEPFGISMIEAMACGTPVVGFARGSVPEVVDDSESGFVVRNTEEAAAAIGKIRHLSRKRCRRVFERRFAASRMAADYVRIYQRLLGEKSAAGAASASEKARDESQGSGIWVVQ
jgi:glycosyltransferase involved in cell wall biosynthesis